MQKVLGCFQERLAYSEEPMEDLAGEKEVTVLISYPHQTKERNKVFFKKKDKELTNEDWSKEGGWFDTDGYFSTWIENKVTGALQLKVGLKLKDKQPVELFSKTFETALYYQTHKTVTPEPYRYEYIAKEYTAQLMGKKAVWFTKNVYPYLIKEEKKDYAAKLLGYRPESKDFADWTADEVIHYLATAIEGDGYVRCSLWKEKSKSLDIEISSSDVQYLSDIRYIADNKLGVVSTLSERITYKTQEGIKTKYGLYILCSRQRPNNLGFCQSLVKDGVMTLDRKREKIQEYVDYIRKG